MFFTFQLIGFLLLATIVASIVQKKTGRGFLPSSILKVLNLPANIAISVVAIFAILSPGLLFYADYGTNYYLISPFGREYAIMDARGIKWRMFSRIIPWTKYIDIKTVKTNSGTGEIIEDTSELEGYIEGGVPIRFVDQVIGEAKFATRFQLPSDEESFVILAKKFRTLTNLVNNTLIPTLEEQAKNTGYMFSAQDYISGAAQEFKQTFEEQLKGGSYQVRKSVIKDTIFNDITDQSSRSIKEIQTTYIVNKVTHPSTGIPIRIPHEITDNGVLVSQVIVQDVELEPKFKERLEKQRDESAKRQLAQQETETAKAEQLKILAMGENEKASERVTREREQITMVIQHETQKEIEKQKLEKAKIALETAEVEAKATRLRADAEAYKNQKLVSAGLTPQERAQIQKEIAIGVAAELKNVQLPTYYISSGAGGDKNGLSLLETLLGIKLMDGTTVTSK